MNTQSLSPSVPSQQSCMPSSSASSFASTSDSASASDRDELLSSEEYESGLVLDGLGGMDEDVGESDGVGEDEEAYPRLDEFFYAHGVFIHERRVIKPFHRKIMKEMTKWVTGTLDGDKRNLAICMPPRHGKTYLARDLVAWCLGVFPDSEWIYTSFSSDLAIAQTIQIRNIITMDWYCDIFEGTRLAKGQNKQDIFSTTAGGRVYGVGVGGTITGFGAGKKRAEFGGGIVIDDPLKAGDAYSDAKREGCNNWYSQVLYSRRNSDRTPILLIMQRLHEHDLVGYIQENEGSIWNILEIPVRDEEGGVLWEETFSKETAERLESIDPYAFSAQYMQKPTPPGGALIKPEWILRYDVIPNECSTMMFTLDTAFKTGEHNDYSVVGCWITNGVDLYLVDLLRGKWEAPDLQVNVTKFLKDNKPRRPTRRRVRGVIIEDKASGTGLVQALRRDVTLSEFPIIAKQRSKDKVSRLNDVIPFIAAGRLHIPRVGVWVEEYVRELISFSPMMTHSHDDQVDVTIDALVESLQIGGFSSGMDLS